MTILESLREAARRLVELPDELHAVVEMAREDVERHRDSQEVRRCATCRFRDLSQRLPCTADHIDEDGSAEFLVRVNDGTGFCHRHEPLPEVPTVEQADQELRAAGVDVDGLEERLRDKIQKARGKTP
jgi:hypothetical protein